MTPEQAAVGEYLQALNNAVSRSAALAAELAAEQQKSIALREQNERQAEEIAALKAQLAASGTSAA